MLLVTLIWEQLKNGNVLVNLRGIYDDPTALAFYFQKLVSRVCSMYLRNRIQQQIDNKGYHWLLETFRERSLCVFNSASGHDRFFDSHNLNRLANEMTFIKTNKVEMIFYLELIGRKIIIQGRGNGCFEIGFYEDTHRKLDIVLQKVLMEVLENEMQ